LTRNSPHYRAEKNANFATKMLKLALNATGERLVFLILIALEACLPGSSVPMEKQRARKRRAVSEMHETKKKPHMDRNEGIDTGTE
jgi:hypothetical protein